VAEPKADENGGGREQMERLDHLLIESLRAAEMRQGCTNHSYYAELLRDQILALIEQEGYVKLADDQSLPENPYEAEINEEHREPASEDDVWLMAYNGFERAKSYMLKAGFRRVEL